jgi:hypothetical protein
MDASSVCRIRCHASGYFTRFQCVNLRDRHIRSKGKEYFLMHILHTAPGTPAHAGASCVAAVHVVKRATAAPTASGSAGTARRCLSLQ